MFYSASTIQNHFKCELCQIKFSHRSSVKVIPECGATICGDCHDNLNESLDDSSRFECRACGKSHTMPSVGLADVKFIMDMLKFQAQEKPLSEEAKRLKQLIEDVQEKISRMKAFNAQDTINIFCDSLQLQVMEVADSTVSQVNKLAAEYVKEINGYRQELLLQLGSHADSSDQVSTQTVKASCDQAFRELTEISERVDEQSRKWNLYFTQLSEVASDADIQRAQKELTDNGNRVSELEEKLNKKIFGGQFLRFKFDKSLVESTKILGDLYYERSAREEGFKAKLIHKLSGHKHPIRTVLFLANGNLATGSQDSTIRIWSTRTGEMLGELYGHSDWVVSLALLQNGRLASGSRDRTIKLWDLNEMKLKRTLTGHDESVISLRVLSNGDLVSCSHDDTIKIWNPVWNSAQKSLRTIRGHGIRKWAIELGVLSNGNLLTCSNEEDKENVIRIWDPAAGSLVKSIQAGSVTSRSLLVLANDTIAVGFHNGLIHVFDSNDANQLGSKVTINSGSVWSLSQLPNGNIVSAGLSHDRLIKVWSPKTGQLIQQFKSEHGAGVFCVRVSADGGLLATGSFDKSAKVWSL